jgi:twinkle protein
MHNIIDSKSINFLEYLRETDAKANVKNAADYTETLKARLRKKFSEKKIYLPWEKTRDNFDFRKGEVTVWAGQNGHGKSLVTSMVALSLIGQEQKVCIASFEMKPHMTVQRMARMFSGENPFDEAYRSEDAFKVLDSLYDDFGGWVDGRLWIYDQQGTADRELVIGMVRYCATELKLDHIFVDNLAKVVSGEDDYNGQKAFVDEMTSIARDHQVHIHIVHHLKKPSKETDLPDKNDLKGSGAIADQVDNIVLVFRNKAKEIAMKSLKSKDLDEKMKEPDQVLFIRKQRNYEGGKDGEPQINLWFDMNSQQYLAEHGGSTLFFANYPHYPS